MRKDAVSMKMTGRKQENEYVQNDQEDCLENAGNPLALTGTDF